MGEVDIHDCARCALLRSKHDAIVAAHQAVDLQIHVPHAALQPAPTLGQEQRCRAASTPLQRKVDRTTGGAPAEQAGAKRQAGGRLAQCHRRSSKCLMGTLGGLLPRLQLPDGDHRGAAPTPATRKACMQRALGFQCGEEGPTWILMPNLEKPQMLPNDSTRPYLPGRSTTPSPFAPWPNPMSCPLLVLNTPTFCLR